MKNKTLFIFCDGGAINNPGPAGIGIVFCDEKGKPIKKVGQFLGQATNNQAEYAAVILALKIALNEFAAQDIQIYLDSELIVQQINGFYKIKNQGLKPLHFKVKLLKMNFRQALFDYIPRKKNREADKLVKMAIKKGLARGKE